MLFCSLSYHNTCRYRSNCIALVKTLKPCKQKIIISIVSNNINLYVIVDDDGPGIPEAQRDDVFKPFYRIEHSRNSQTGGVGLGLTIVRDVIRSHGGEVTLGKSPSGGLRVNLSLPL